MRSRAEMARVAEAALRKADQAEARADRLARSLDRLPGLLALHCPKAQPPYEVAGHPPTIWCAECSQPYPCRSLQYVWQFGEFVTADPPAVESAFDIV